MLIILYLANQIKATDNIVMTCLPIDMFDKTCIYYLWSTHRYCGVCFACGWASRNKHYGASERQIWKENLICSTQPHAVGFTFLFLQLTRKIVVTVVDQQKARQRFGRVMGNCLQSALPRLFSFLLKQWNPSTAAYTHCKKANSRWC